AQIIRNRDQTKGIPIVFLSAVNKETEHQLRGYSMGAVDYVFKPVDPVILRSKVAVFVELFEKSKEVEHKARHEQALLDANLRANGRCGSSGFIPTTGSRSSRRSKHGANRARCRSSTAGNAPTGPSSTSSIRRCCSRTRKGIRSSSPA